MKPLTVCSALAPLAAFALLLSCAGPEPRPAAEPNLSSASSENIRAVDWPTLGTGAARFIRIDLGPDTFAECQKLSPKFPFDSATANAQDRMQLTALGTCLNAPSMRDRKLVLVGRADAQGTAPYNEELGMKRALAIKQLLVDNGVAENRIEVATEGKKGAVGDKPEYAPGYDRRVDIIVKGGTHTP